MEIIVKFTEFERHYHLCPVCGMPSGTTSRTCSKHITVTYDSWGNIIEWTNVIENEMKIYMDRGY